MVNPRAVSEKPETITKSLAPGISGSPYCLIFAGRGGTGKSTHARLHTEWIQRAAMLIKIGDVDRTNATLTAFYSDLVESPPTADDKDVMNFLEKIIESQIEEKYNLILDFGGGDLILKNLALRINLVEFFDRHGIEPVLFHHLGADMDYLSYLTSLEENNLFTPRRTIVVLNEFIKPSTQSVETAFDMIIGSRQLRAVLERGARMISLPELFPAPHIDRKRLSFYEALENLPSMERSPLGPFKRQILKEWLRTVEERFRDAEIDLPWIPAKGVTK